MRWGHLVIAGLFACSYRDLGGFSGAPSDPADAGTATADGAIASALRLRTQASASAEDATSVDLVVNAGTKAGDVLFVVVWSRGPAKVTAPPGFTELQTNKNPCAATGVTIFTAEAGDAAQIAPKFTLDVAARVEATLLVLTGIDPIFRAKNVSEVAYSDTNVQPPTVTAGTADVPGHALLVFAIPDVVSTPPQATLLSRNTATSIFSVPVTTAGAFTPPALEEQGRCGDVYTLLFKDR